MIAYTGRLTVTREDRVIGRRKNRRQDSEWERPKTGS